MRLSRPVMLGLLLVCGLIVLWLVAQTVDAGGDTSEGPGTSQGAGAPRPSGTAYPEESDAGGATGTDTRDWDGIDACQDDVLPPELEEVADDVEAGGPFEYEGKDGSTFGNREGLLPDEARDYREYTVETPGSPDRGARRIVTGGGDTDPEVWYYTEDHYESFCEFAP